MSVSGRNPRRVRKSDKPSGHLEYNVIRRRRSNQRIGAARHPRWPRRDSWLVVWGRVRRVTPHDQQPSKYGRNYTSTVFCIPVNTLRDACEKSQPISHLPNTCQWARNHPPSHASALRTSIWWQSDILAVGCRPAATCVSRHFATPPRPRTTFRWAATAQAASVVVGEMVCAASCASPASRRPRDGVENRHFFAPRHRRNGPQDRRKLQGKVRIRSWLLCGSCSWHLRVAYDAESLRDMLAN